jgi:hypothetical protein
MVVNYGALGRPLCRPHQQGRYLPLQHLVARQPDGIPDASRFQVLVQFRLGKGGVTSKQQPHRLPEVALDNGVYELLPAIGAVYVSSSENRPFPVPVQ